MNSTIHYSFSLFCFSHKPPLIFTLCLDSYLNPTSDSTQLHLFIMSVVLEFTSAFLILLNVLLIVNFSLSFVISYGWDVTVGGLVGLDCMRWCFDSWLKISWLNFNILNIYYLSYKLPDKIKHIKNSQRRKSSILKIKPQTKSSSIKYNPGKSGTTINS